MKTVTNYFRNGSKFNIAEMRYKIDFLKKVQTDEFVENLQPKLQEVLTGIYAKKIKLLGRESIILKATENIVQTNFIIRYREDISEDMVIRCNDVFYEIVGFETLKDNNSFLLIATIRKDIK